MIDWEKIVQPDRIKDYLKSLRRQGVKPATIKRRRAALEKFRQFAQEKLALKEAGLPLSAEPVKPLSLKEKAFLLPQRLINLTSAIPAYFRYAALTIFVVALGLFVYDQFIKRAPEQLAYPTSLTPPARVLSFQGRLTDSGDTPITTATNVVFRLYDAETGGTTLWTSNTCSIDPDENGIFAVRLGATSGADACGPEIPASVFSENIGVWLEVEVAGETLSPRQPIATAAYALNAETLQGYPASASATANTVPVINNNGDLVIAAASPSIQSTSGTFGIVGQALLIQTPDTSDGDITINPDGSGVLNLTFEGSSPGGSAGGFINATNANLTSGALYYGEVASDATGYNLLELASGATPTTKFSVNASGDTYVAGKLGVGYSPTDITNGIAAFSGNVGIGTTEPQYELDVVGSARVKDTLYLLGSSESSIGYIKGVEPNITEIQGAGYINHKIADRTSLSIEYTDIYAYSNLHMVGNTIFGSDTASGNLTLDSSSDTNKGFVLINPSGGNVGIGTTDPGEKLEVNGNIWLNNGQLRLGNYGTNPTAIGEGSLIYNTTDDKLYYYTASGWSEVGSGSGGSSYWQRNLGALSPLNIADDLLMGATATSSALIRLAGLSGEDVWFNTGGNVGIGDTNPTEGRLVVNGTIYATTQATAANEAVLGGRTLTAGDGLTGGGDLTSDRTLAVGAGNGITVNADDVAVNQAYNFAWTGAHSWSSSADFNGDISIADTDIALDGASTTFTSTGNLTFNSGSGQVLLSDGDTLNIGGVSGLSYNAISDSSTASHAASDNDLYVEDVLEVGNSLYVGGTAINQYWQLNDNVLSPYPYATVYDLAVGGTATSSAQFHVNASNGTVKLSNGETIVNTTDGNIAFSGSGGTNDTDLTIDLDGSSGPVIFSNTDAFVHFNDSIFLDTGYLQRGSLVFNSSGLGSFSAADISITPDATGDIILTTDSDTQVFFSSNKDTNLYRAAADTLRTNDSLIVDGDLGIGTTDPSSFKLQVAGNVGPDADANYDLGSSSLRWGTIYGNSLNLSSDNNDSLLSVDFLQVNRAATMSATIDTDKPLVVNAVSDQTANIVEVNSTADAGGDLFVIDSGGNVGIGTTEPGYKLDIVDGSVMIHTNNRLYLGATNDNVGSIYNPCGSSPCVRLSGAGATLTLWAGSPKGVIQADGKMVIGGTSSTNYSLSFYNTSANTTIALYDYANKVAGIGYQAASDQLRLHLNSSAGKFSFLDSSDGNEIVTFQGTGNVGIGTTGPNAKLEVLATSEQLRLVYDTDSYTQFTVNNDGDLTIGLNGNGEDPKLIVSNDLQIKGGDILDWYQEGETEISTTRISIGKTITLYPNNSVNNYVRIINESSGVSDGNIYTPLILTRRENTLTTDYEVGIRFDLQETTTVKPTALITAQLADTGNNYGRLHFWTRNGGSPDPSYTRAMTIDHLGNVGIGTVSPDRLLHVEVSDAITNAVTYAQRLSHITSGTAAAGFGTGIEFELEDAGGGNDIAGAIQTVWSSATGGAEESKMHFLTTDVGDDGLAIRMTLDKDGNVGIGTTNPEAKLEVTGAILQSATDPTTILFHNTNESGTPTGDGFRIRYDSDFYGAYTDALIIEKTDENGADPDGGISFVNTGNDGIVTPALTIRGNGYVGIGTTSPSYKLHVTGDIYANSGWLRTSGKTGWYSQSYGGGWYMSDSTWIRSYGNKSIYHNTGTMRTDGTFQVGSGGSTLSVANGGNFAYRSNVLFANTSGNVGIGTTSPSHTLTVCDTSCTTINGPGVSGNRATWYLVNSYSGSNITMHIYNDNRFRFNYNGWGTAEAGWNTGAVDYAEIFKKESKEEKIEAGDLVAAASQNSQITKTRQALSPKILGIVSTKPGFLAGNPVSMDEEDSEPSPYEQPDIYKPIALAGRAPAKVTTTNGIIVSGDPITSSFLPGVGMKMTVAGPIVGKALESTYQWNEKNCPFAPSLESISWPEDDGTNPAKPCFRVPVSSLDPETQAQITSRYSLTTNDYIYVGKIMVFVNVSWYDPDVYLTDSGDLEIAGPITNEATTYELKDKEGNLIDRIGAFAEVVAAKIRAGIVETKELVGDLGYLGDLRVENKVLSPIVETTTLQVDETEDLTIETQQGEEIARFDGETKQTSLFGDLLVEGETTIAGKLSVGSEVIESEAPVQLEVKGSASVAGQLAAKEISAQEASFSAIYADEIITKKGTFGELLADKIAAVRAELEELIAKNKSNYDQGVQKEEADVVDSPTGTSLASQAESWDTSVNEASVSAWLLDQGQLSTETVLAAQLSIQGKATIEEALINKHLLVGNIAITENAISTLAETLYLQPSGVGKVDILAGIMIIEDNGNVTINGNLAVKGTVSAQEYRGADGNFQISLGSTSGFGQLLVKDAEGQTVAAIDASGSAQFAGDLIASGSATFAKINIATGSAEPIVAGSAFGELATDSAQLKTNATAGEGVIPAGKTEVVIYSDKMTPESLVYITPTTDTENQVLFVKEKADDHFTVAIKQTLEKEIRFNWWIIN